MCDDLYSMSVNSVRRLTSSLARFLGSDVSPDSDTVCLAKSFSSSGLLPFLQSVVIMHIIMNTNIELTLLSDSY